MLPNTVMLTLATEGYVPFVLNLHASLERIGLGGQLVVHTLDDASHRALTRAGLGCRRVALESGHRWANWRTPGFKRIMRAKYAAALAILESGRNAWFVDSDIVMLRDPSAHLQDVVEQTSADLVLQCQAPARIFNAGFWLATPAPAVLDLFTRIRDELGASESWTCDQDLLNARVPEVPGLRAHALDPALFACGNQFLKGKRAAPFDAGAAFLLHFNFIIGMESKVAAMQEHGALLHQDLARYGPSFRRTVVRRFGKLRAALTGRA